MAKVFKVTPKRIKRSNGLVLTPDMSVIVTTRQHMTSPFNNGSKELRHFVLSIQSVLDVGAKIGFWNAKQRQGYKYLTFSREIICCRILARTPFTFVSEKRR